MIGFKKWLVNNIDIKLLAFVMAIILWFYLASEYNISAEKYYDIEIVPINLDHNLSIKEIRDKVSVGIKGPQNIIENISAQKIVGTVDLQNIKEAGEYQLVVQTIIPKNTNIVKTIPDEIRVTVEAVLKREYVVEYNLIGLPEKGYSLKGEPEIVPNEVVVTGPGSVLNQIEQVKIDIDISSISNDLSSVEKVAIYSTDSSIINNIDIQPETVSILVQVGEGYPEKVLPVKPRIIGKPAPGFFVSKIEADPNQLEIYGNYSKISFIDFLETIPIDVNGITKTLTVKVPPIMGEGIYLTDEQQALIEIQIQVEEREEEQLFEDIIIEIREASPFLDYQLNPEMVDIRVGGKYSCINTITKEDIKVYVDLSDAGEDKIKLQTELPSEINLIRLIPEEVVISIK
jgi:YbbR domain-containing protein